MGWGFKVFLGFLSSGFENVHYGYAGDGVRCAWLAAITSDMPLLLFFWGGCLRQLGFISAGILGCSGKILGFIIMGAVGFQRYSNRVRVS